MSRMPTPTAPAIPSAQRLLDRGRALSPPIHEVVFDYAGSGKNIAILQPLIGRRGWLSCERATLTALETEDHLLFAGLTDEGEPLDQAQCRRLFDLLGTAGRPATISPDTTGRLEAAQASVRREIFDEVATHNGRWFETEMDKLDHWAEDRRARLKAELNALDDSIKETKRSARLAPNLPEKLSRQRELRTLESKRDEAWRDYDQASRTIDQQKDQLLDDISGRLEQRAEREPLFTLRWTLN